MAVDLNFGMLTDASANLGNALVNAAGNVRQHRETGRNREAVRNYLTNPNDAGAFQGLAERNPEMAFRLRDEQAQRVRQLRADQQQQVQFLGRILRGVRDEAGYQGALSLARQAGIDVTGHETYDPNFVGQIQELDRVLNRVAPVSVAEGAQLVDPESGRVVASTPARPRYYPVQPGGRLELDPSYQGPVADAAPTEAPAFAPAPAGAPSEYSNLPNGSPLQGGGQNIQIVRVSTPAEAMQLPPGTRYMTPDGRQFVR